MSKRITITVPDGMDTEDAADYVLFVSQQLREGYNTSGHVAVSHHWDLVGLS